jgi:hypothetical protein
MTVLQRSSVPAPFCVLAILFALTSAIAWASVKGEHFILVLNNGGGMNGTTYFEELPKNQLDLGLFIEADRMRSLNITQANLDISAAIVVFVATTPSITSWW